MNGEGMNTVNQDHATGIEESLLQTLERTPLKSTAFQLLEVGLDAVLAEGVARDIPVIGCMVSAVSTAVALRDRLFVHKLLRFLTALDEVPEADRKRQIDRLASSGRERQRLGAHLLLLIDRLNDLDKPELLARAFQALLENRITRVQFQGLACAIEGILPDHVRWFQGYMEGASAWHNPIRGDEEPFPNLLQCGLITIRLANIDITPRWSNGSVKTAAAGDFPISALGQLFYEMLLKDRQSVPENDHAPEKK